ncbi:MAG: alkaline phosphatase family protein [Elainellaceae cyanobacterium]
MKHSVIAIGLDAADPTLIETWMAQGHLKTLQRLRDRGTYGRLTNSQYYKAETPWTTFLTGCLPEKTGYWAPLKFREGTYEVDEVQAYDFAEYPPFYALGQDYRVAVFDMPQSVLTDQANGPQVLAWGAHSPQTPTHSLPESFLQTLCDRHGKHPALHKDHGDWWDQTYLTRLQKNLKQGIKRRISICREILQHDQWDLFLTVFGEPHSAGHDFWYLSQPDHPLHAHRSGIDGDPLLDVFKEMDRAIGEIVSDVPDDTYVMVFAAHGSGNNTTDVSSMMFLPEFLYRFSFPGQVMLAPGKAGAPVPPVVTSPRRKTWSGEIWERKHEPNLLKRLLRRQLPTKFHPYLDTVLGRARQPDLVSPQTLQEQGHFMAWQPTLWYSPLWPQMQAFAIPSFSEGYIRINLAGREPDGIVAPDDYETLCNSLTHELKQLVNARTGKPVVKTVIQPRLSAGDRHPKRPDADLIVIWSDEPADVVDHPKFGRIGPVPYRRTGSHRGRGFLIATGPGIEPQSTLPEKHAVDLAPTILHLMGVPIPDYFDGTPILQPSVSQLATPQLHQ